MTVRGLRKLAANLALALPLVAAPRLGFADEIKIDPPKPDTSVGLTVKCEKNLCGYVGADGKFVIPKRYKSAMPFYEGLANVSETGSLWGVINPKGDLVVPMNYKSIGPFSQGLAPAQPDPKHLDHWVYLGKDGAVAIDFKFKVVKATTFDKDAAWITVPVQKTTEEKQIDRFGIVLKTVTPKPAE